MNLLLVQESVTGTDVPAHVLQRGTGRRVLNLVRLPASSENFGAKL